MPLVIVKVILIEYIKIQCSKYELEKSEVCENRDEKKKCSFIPHATQKVGGRVGAKI